MSIEDTSKRDPLLLVAGAWGNPGHIEEMEAQGQAQLLNSTELPTDMREGRQAYEALGFTLGAPHPNDPMFCPATLPEGWTRAATDHSMWSRILDQHGRERVEIFYKAAFYDRRAFMRLNTPYSYLSRALDTGVEPVMDDEWLPCEATLEALAELHKDAAKDKADCERWAERDDSDGHYGKRITELTAKLGRIEALQQRLSGAVA